MFIYPGFSALIKHGNLGTVRVALFATRFKAAQLHLNLEKGPTRPPDTWPCVEYQIRGGNNEFVGEENGLATPPFDPTFRFGTSVATWKQTTAKPKSC
jgi:hypothetical protein